MMTIKNRQAVSLDEAAAAKDKKAPAPVKKETPKSKKP
jgi:hypothetical protein